MADQKFLIPPRTSSGREIEKWHNQVCQFINELRGVRNTLARAYLTGSPHQTINDNTYTKVLLDTESWDIGGNFDSATNYRYVFPVTGKYQVNFNALLYDANASINTAHSGIYVNGSEVLRGAMYLGPDITFFGSPGGGTLDVTAGQYAELWALGNTTDNGTLIVYTGSPYTYMDIYLIST